MINKEDYSTELDFFGENRFYHKDSHTFTREWNMKVYSNSLEDAIRTLDELNKWFKKADEIDIIEPYGHFMLKEVTKQ